MNSQSICKFASVSALAALTALFSAPLLAVGDSGSAAFDRQTALLGQQLRRGEIVIDTSAPQPPRALGAEGRPGEAVAQRDVAVDTGSRWFNSYVEQVNRRLQTRTEMGDR